MLREAGYTVELVDEHERLGPGTPDGELLSYGGVSGLTLLTGDFEDFSRPPHADHCGVVLFNTDREPGEEPAADAFLIGLERLLSRYDGLDGEYVFLRQWFPD